MSRSEGPISSSNSLPRPRGAGAFSDGHNTLPRQREKGAVRIKEGERDRPLSLYDNLKDESPRESPSRSLGPSMASAMVTTVPQNIAAPKIEGRHAPTRTSLRHSRMIVLTRQGKVPRKYLPRVVKRHKLATSLLILQLLMGIAICTLAAWLLLWAPNLPFKDIPYWSGLPVLMASIIGIILLCSCRKEYPGMPVKYHVLAFKIMSMLASFGASMASFIATGFASHHLLRLQGMICEPANVLVMPCVCRSRTDVLTYQDLNCVEVLSILTVLLIASISANAFAGFLSAWYLCLHLSSSSPYAYSQVRTNDNRPIILTNKN